MEYNTFILGKDGFVREKKIREILNKSIITDDDVYKLFMSFADRVWKIPILVASNINKISDEQMYKFFTNHEDLYYFIRGRMISIWNNYHQDLNWYNEYPTMPQRLKDYTPYKAFKDIENTLRNKYGLVVSKARNK